MIHKMTARSNPRLLIYYTIIVALPLAGAATISRFPKLVTVAAVLLGSWLSYRLFKFARPYLETKIVTEEKGATYTLPEEGDVFIPWNEVDLSGKCSTRRGKPFLFVYHQGRDKLITIPFEYEDMPGLQTELEEKTPFETFHFEPGMHLRGVLQERFPNSGKKKEE